MTKVQAAQVMTKSEALDRAMQLAKEIKEKQAELDRLLIAADNEEHDDD